MGWNNLFIKKESKILKDITDKDMFYFVHSFYATCNLKDNILALSKYGTNFVSSFQKENIFGVQFHPEKSHDQGLKLLKNFAMI